MNRIREILVRARDTLADPKGDKWTDAELLRLLDEAQKDLCRRAKLLRSEVTFNVKAGEAFYSLPDDFMFLDSAYLNDKALLLKGHAELDKDGDWQNREGNPYAIVFDKQLRGKFRLYPTPNSVDVWAIRNTPVRVTEENARIRENFGVVTGVEFPNRITSDFGVTTAVRALWQYQEDETAMPQVVQVDYNFSQSMGVATGAKIILKADIDMNPWGVITDFDGVASSDPWGIVTSIDGWPYADVRFNDTWGVAADNIFVEPLGYYKHFMDVGMVTDVCGAHVPDLGLISAVSMIPNVKMEVEKDFGMITGLKVITDTLKCLYIRRPKTLEDLDSELEVDESMDAALKFYVTGRALTNSVDVQNRAFGNEEMARYYELTSFAQTDDSKDFTRSSKVWYSNYNGGI